MTTRGQYLIGNIFLPAAQYQLTEVFQPLANHLPIHKGIRIYIYLYYVTINLTRIVYYI